MTAKSRQRNLSGTGEESSVVYETILLCQPDGKKSCTACCGLFNFRDISRENLARFLEEGASRSGECIKSGNSPDEGDGSAIRDSTSYICPHQGLIFNRRPGCLLHPAYRITTLRNQSFFGEKICNGFLCPAHELLPAEHKKLIIDHLDDWYAYSIAIIDPLFSTWLLDLLANTYPDTLKRIDVIDNILFDCLMIHARYLGERPGPVFFYSLAEYSAARKNAAPDGRDVTDEESAAIEEAIRKHL